MNLPEFTLADYRAAADFIRGRTARRPAIGIILGSGLGDFVSAIHSPDVIAYADIPNWPHSKVVGHGNRLVIGELEGQTILALQGRAHYYEGWTMAQITFPVRVMQVFGIKTLIVTNAAGGINKEFQAGDLMLIRDHINLLGMGGMNPLRGPNDETLGPRFPDMSKAYDPQLRALARSVAAEKRITLREGVYAGLSGPNFESPAEIRFLRAIGADAVGMSTVSEVTVARHGGLRVLGFSGISNTTIDSEDAEAQTTHEEVLEAGKQIVPNLIAVLRGVLRGMPSQA